MFIISGMINKRFMMILDFKKDNGLLIMPKRNNSCIDIWKIKNNYRFLNYKRVNNN